jgi:hypothetical protein
MSGSASNPNTELRPPVVIREGEQLYRGSSLHGSSHADPFPPSPGAVFYATQHKDEAQEYSKEAPHITWTYDLKRDVKLFDQRPLASKDGSSSSSPRRDNPFHRAFFDSVEGDEKKTKLLRDYFFSLAKLEAPSGEADRAAIAALSSLPLPLPLPAGEGGSCSSPYEGIIRCTKNDYLGRVVEEILLPGSLFSQNTEKADTVDRIVEGAAKGKSASECRSTTDREKGGSTSSRVEETDEIGCPFNKPGDKVTFPVTPTSTNAGASNNPPSLSTSPALSLVEMLKCPPNKGKAE